MRILHDSKSEVFKKPFGCLRQDEKCEINIHIPSSCGTKKVFLCLDSEDGLSMKVPMRLLKKENDYDIYSVDFSLFMCGLYFYYFHIETFEGEFDLFKWGYDETNMCTGDKWQITCFDKDYDTPEDFKGNVMYQIFPDRFNKSGDVDLTDKLTPYWIHENTNDVPHFKPNEQGEVLNNDFYGGNLKGIADKMDYIASLGTKTIYLNPIFMAFSNHRYDTADYKRIDPMLGCEDDFVNLCKVAHKRGIKIILDGVFSHTGCNSIYFDKYRVFGNGAYSNPDSPYKSWFQFENYPEKYTSWWGIITLPCVNELNEDYLNYIIEGEDSVIEHWLNLGADGYRLDVADELPDKFILRLKNKVKQIKPDAIVIGEVWEDASNKEAYSVRRRYFVDSELDSVMNYPYRNAIIDFVRKRINAKTFKECIMNIAEHYPKPVMDCVMNSLSTHDTARILNVLESEGEHKSKEEKAILYLEGDKLKNAIDMEMLASFLQVVLPGCPCIYYGDEAGLQGYDDPLNRRYFPWDNINSDILSHYRELAKLKNTYEPLKTGDILVREIGEYAVEIIRKTDKETLKLLINLGNETYKFDFEKSIYTKKANVEGCKLLLTPGSYAIIK